MKITCFVKPTFNGLCGFILFLSVVLLIKIVSSLFGTAVKPLIDSGDILLCMVGFVMNFLISVLHNSKNENESKEIHNPVGSEKM